jgi:hypothetical protein
MTSRVVSRAPVRARLILRSCCPLGHTAVEQVELFRQNDPGLHHVEIVHLAKVDGKELGAEQIRLLLVVAFDADAIAGPRHGLQQPGRVTRIDDLALRQFHAGCDAGVMRFSAVRLSLHNLCSCVTCCRAVILEGSFLTSELLCQFGGLLFAGIDHIDRTAIPRVFERKRHDFPDTDESQPEFDIPAQLDFGSSRRRMRGRFAYDARYAAEFRYGLGAAAT